MNQYIEILYYTLEWEILFLLNAQFYRDKAPSHLESDGYWTWNGTSGWKKHSKFVINLNDSGF